MVEALSDRPLGIYIHFPFCRRRCPYCDFNVNVAKTIPHRAYADAVLTELDARAARFDGGRLVSIYFGGGTPALWDPAEIGRVVDAVRGHFELYDDGTDRRLNTLLYGASAPNLEVTLEINPGGVGGPEVLQKLVDAGVNRLSVGVQTLDARYLQRLHRDHTVEDSLAMIEGARQAGIKRVSFDLLFGGPGHTLDAFRADLGRAGALAGTDHCSAYSLIVEAGTPFARWRDKGKLNEADEDLVADMVELCEVELRGHGYHRYEISSYAREGREARHNSLYWIGAETMGLGVGAHELAFVDGHVERRAGAVRLEDYLAEPVRGGEQVEVVSPRTHLAECLYLGLRTRFGVSLDELAGRFGDDMVAEVSATLGELEAEGLIHEAQLDAGPSYLGRTGDRLVPTPRGYLFNDAIARRLL